MQRQVSVVSPSRIPGALGQGKVDVVVAAVHDGFEWNEEQLAVERAEIMDVVDTLYRYSSVMLASIIPTVS